VGDTSLMQCDTRNLSDVWRQALKKSACMVDGLPEEMLTGPLVVGKWRKMTFMVSTGTGIGWLAGHRSSPPIGLL
jgi:hypothetical protein